MGPEDLVEAVCTACHTLERVVAKRGTKAEWQDKVLEMLQEDPDITQQERDQIVAYLAAHFRPLPKICEYGGGQGTGGSAGDLRQGRGRHRSVPRRKR